METLLQDVRYGVRMLLKKPAFTAVAVIALALGIGANSAIFSVVNALLLQPLPYKDPDRLVMIWHKYPKLNLPQASVSVPGYIEYRDNTTSFEQVAAATSWNVNLTGVGEPERLEGGVVTANFLPALGVEPARGRNFFAEEDQPGKNQVVIISHGLWQRRFGGDPDVLGQAIKLNGSDYEVVGIMPAGFNFLINIDVYSPIAFTPEQMAPTNGVEYLVVAARMKAGVTVGQAQAEMDTVAAKLRELYFGEGSNWGITLVPLHEQIVGDIRPTLLVLLAAVGCVLLIACANVANLLLARATSRQKEIAVRTALGANRWRVVRQLLTESVLLAAVGGALGLGLAFVGVRLLITGAPQEIARFATNWKEIGIDGWVLGFTLAVSVLTGIVFGLFPALQASRPDLTEALKEGGRSANESGSRNLFRRVLVVMEVAISLVLLVGAGLLVRSFMRLQEVSPGFDPRNVLTMQLSLPRTKYAENHQVVDFYTRTLQQVEAVPGVQAVGIVNNIPMGINNHNAVFAVEGLDVPQGEPNPHGDPHMIDPDYFRAMGIPLLQGRYFNEQDSKDSLQVAIVDQTLAERYWPGESPLGKRIAAFFEGSSEKQNWRTVVGVVGYVKQYGLDGKSKVQYYFPHTQRPQRAMYLVVRSNTDAAALAGSVRGAIQQVDSDQPVFRVMTMQEVFSNSMAQRRFSMFLLAVFAGVALLLAAVGIYGVMSYSVTQRTHEIGIRMALGAQRGDVLRMILKQGLAVTLIGVAVGLVASLAMTRVMASLLFGVSATDTITFVAIPVLLTVTASLASYIPARRALKVDPIVALRYE